MLYTPGQKSKLYGHSYIVCCKPYDDREGACRTLTEIDLNTGHPVPQPPQPQYQQVADANYGYSGVPPPVPAPPAPEPNPQAPDFTTALHGWAEQTHEMITHLAENVRLLTAVVEEMKQAKQ